jgi:tRNA(adenine34) deaminase
MLTLSSSQQLYMRKALEQARYALEEDEVPVGAAVVYKDKVIARAHNQVERLHDPTAHAEMIAITQAADFLKSKWLFGCTLYITVEPCSMCAGALILSRIDRIIFGASDPKTGAFGSKINVNTLRLNHRIKIKKGILERECSQLLKDFFKEKRTKRRAGS